MERCKEKTKKALKMEQFQKIKKKKGKEKRKRLKRRNLEASLNQRGTAQRRSPLLLPPPNSPSRLSYLLKYYTNNLNGGAAITLPLEVSILSHFYIIFFYFNFNFAIRDFPCTFIGMELPPCILFEKLTAVFFNGT